MRLALCSLVVAALVPALHAQQPAPQVPSSGPGAYVTASGVGETEVTPDRARLSIGVHTQAPTAADASARNARLQRAVIDTVRALGVPQERITTSGYNVFPEQTFDQPTRRSRIVGYNVQNTVVIDVHQVEQVGRILDAALAKGANLVSSLSFYSSKAEEARRRALANAVERARRDAEVMAQAAGGRLGELVDVSSSSFVDRPRPMMDMAEARVMAASAPTPISEGTQTVSAMVTARWRFVPGAQ
jgi:uncharacterized protein YggE